MPGSAFMTAGRSACMNTSHRLAKDDQDFLASCPGNSPRPLAGRLGGICPGGQYWPPHYSAGRYQQKDVRFHVFCPCSAPPALVFKVFGHHLFGLMT
eukprot:g15161.t1